ncbi:3-keto-5-aminohexanoate cleavage protein [Roseovarius sp. C7]|uniref:3-keto-5-aminohexanoate cleavage protein n=1 Tax=Roseovarius sp. C7 TaxID=3398643 RepID=UPI0039F70673
MVKPYIMAAPNGARRGKADHPALPVSIAETVAAAAACHAAGADALHLHVRDAEGRHSLDPGLYAEALSEMARVLPDMRVQITTEAAGIFGVADQLACLEALRPGWASISVREMARAPELTERVYGLCAGEGIEVQHILYDAADAALLQEWQARGIVRGGQDKVIFVLGRYEDGPASVPAGITPFLEAMPGVGDWMICAFGAAEHACLAEAARLGGALRVGFENALVGAEGNPHADNAASVRRLVALIEGDKP